MEGGARPDGAGTVAVPPATGSRLLDAVVGGVGRRRGVRLVLAAASVGLLVAAAAIVAYPFYTNLLQDRYQSRLDRQLESPDLRQAYLDRHVADR